jgi:hypothetical protein
VVDPSDVIAAVVADAQRRDPSLPEDAASVLAARALDSGLTDAADIARAVLDDGVDVSWVNAVAAAVAEVRGSSSR